MNDRAYEILTAGRLLAKTKAPYFRALLLSYVLREAPGLGTVGVTKNRIMLWDPAFVADLKPEEMAGVWIHECLHSLNRHPHRKGARDMGLFALACDLSINPAVREMGVTLPGGKHTGVFPKNYGFDEGATAEEYYELLQKQQQGGGGGKGPPEEPGVGTGYCGSCSGRPVPGEPDENDTEGRSDGEMERTIREVAEEVQSRIKAQGIGSVPGHLRRWADEALKPPKVPWRAKLAQLARRAVAWRPGAVDHRYDGPSRRQAGIGFGVGRPVLPRLRSPVPRVAIVVDTSGSMGSKEIIECLTEAQGIVEAVGADVEFCACDARVHELRPVANVRDMAKLLKGGGGTDFRPAFEALSKKRPRPEVIVFATDGYGPAPEVAPAGMRTIWLLVGGNEDAPAAWGDKIVVKDDE
jgi:predicted metal-dependent peptidase